jgi:crossover junction endodeoxyribonuclease RuvC
MMKNKLQIAGIDLSLNGTGICVNTVMQPIHALTWEHQQGYSFTTCTFRETKKRKTQAPEKWRRIRSYTSVATPTIHTIVFIEGYAYMDFMDRGIRYVEVTPTVLKKFVSGNGNANKDIILKEVYRRWGMDLNDHNLADAFVLTKIGEAVLNPKSIFSKEQKRLAATIRAEHAWLEDL